MGKDTSELSEEKKNRHSSLPFHQKSLMATDKCSSFPRQRRFSSQQTKSITENHKWSTNNAANKAPTCNWYMYNITHAPRLRELCRTEGTHMHIAQIHKDKLECVCLIYVCFILYVIHKMYIMQCMCVCVCTYTLLQGWPPVVE